MATADMTVEIQAIPPAGLDRVWTCDAERLEIDPAIVELCGPARVAARITRNGREVQVRGTVQARLGMACGRCLETFEQETTLELNTVYFAADVAGTSGNRHAPETPDVNLAWSDGKRCNLERFYEFCHRIGQAGQVHECREQDGTDDHQQQRGRRLAGFVENLDEAGNRQRPPHHRE